MVFALKIWKTLQKSMKNKENYDTIDFYIDFYIVFYIDFYIDFYFDFYWFPLISIVFYWFLLIYII
jgi:hypothetical protein